MERHAAELKQLSVVEIGLFGSWASGKPHRGSDVDILVEFAPGAATVDNFFGVQFLLERCLHRRVDLVIKSAVKPALRQHILESTRYVAID